MDLFTLALQMPGWPEMLLVLGIALLIFGKRLPEVGRSLGKGIVEFKNGLRGLKDEMDEVDHEVRRAGEHDEASEKRRPALGNEPDETPDHDADRARSADKAPTGTSAGTGE